MNATEFSLMSGVNEKICLVQHKSCCACKCRLNESVCNTKQKWYHGECWCKELDNSDSCEKFYMWNPSTCDCECNEVCKIDKYLDTKICSCKKCLIYRLKIECGDEILNPTETLIIKSSMCKK